VCSVVLSSMGAVDSSSVSMAEVSASSADEETVLLFFCFLSFLSCMLVAVMDSIVADIVTVV